MKVILKVLTSMQAPIARLESLGESLDGTGKTESGAHMFEHSEGDGGAGIPRQRSSDV